jgi:hypothetical protein
MADKPGGGNGSSGGKKILDPTKPGTFKLPPAPPPLK